MDYHVEGSFILPFALSPLPNLRVAGVQDGDQDVDHQDGHDDLVAHPDGDANRVGELEGEVFVFFVKSFHVNRVMVVREEHPPGPGDEEAPHRLEVFSNQGVVGCSVLPLRLLERLEHGPGAHGVGTPHHHVDEDDAEDINEHSVDAHDDRTQMFNYDEAANCPKIRRTSFQLKVNFYLKYAMKTPRARKVSAMLTMLLPEMFALSTLALEQKVW